VLENFEIKILLKMKKKASAALNLQAGELHKYMPSTAVSMTTSAIKINLSHYIFNQLANLPGIVEISSEQ